MEPRPTTEELRRLIIQDTIYEIEQSYWAGEITRRDFNRLMKESRECLQAQK